MPETKPKRHKTNEGKRARHSATKEAAPYTPGWFKKVIKWVGLSACSLCVCVCVCECECLSVNQVSAVQFKPAGNLYNKAQFVPLRERYRQNELCTLRV